MPLLARNISKPGPWVDGEEHWNGDDFPFHVLSELAEGRSAGLSVFEVKSVRDRDLARIAAALWLGSDQSAIKQSQFRFVHTDQLEHIGVTCTKTKGALPIDSLNSKHYEISGLDGPKAIELARCLFKEVKVVAFKTMLLHVARELHNRNIDISSIKKPAWPEFQKRKALAIRQAALKRTGGD